MKKQLLERLFFGVFISLLLVLLSVNIAFAAVTFGPTTNLTYNGTASTDSGQKWITSGENRQATILINNTGNLNITAINISIPSNMILVGNLTVGAPGSNITNLWNWSGCYNHTSNIVSCNRGADGLPVAKGKEITIIINVTTKGSYTWEANNQTWYVNATDNGTTVGETNTTFTTGIDGLAPQVTAVSLTDGQNVRTTTGSTFNLTRGWSYVKNASLTITATIADSGAGIQTAMVCYTVNGSQPRAQCPDKSGLGILMTNSGSTYTAVIPVSNLTGAPAWIGVNENQLSFIIISNDSASGTNNGSNINLSKNYDSLTYNVTIQQGTLNSFQPTDIPTTATWNASHLGAHTAQFNDTILLNVSMNTTAYNTTKSKRLGNSTYLQGWYAIVNATGASTITWNALTLNTNTLNANSTLGALFNSTSVNDGAHVIMFNVTDGAYWSTINITNVTIDNNGPTASISLSKTSMTTAESTTVTCGGSDGSYGSDGYCDIAGRGCSPFNYTIDVQVPGEAQYTSISTGPTTTSASYTPTTAGTFTARCQVNDYQGTGSTTSTFAVTFSGGTTGGSGGGGGSSGSGTTTTTIPAAATSNIGAISTAGANAVMAANAAATFTVPVTTGTTQAHSVKVKSIETNKVTITVSSTPQDVTLSVNETKTVDLDGDKKADLELKLNRITTDNRADLTFKAIKAAEAVTPTTTTTGAAPTTAKTSKSAIWIIVIVILVILIVGYFVLRKKK